jgi:hypothetical protein
MDSTTFDRSKPIYRLFEMEGGARQWWTVELDNTPGRPLNDYEAPLVAGMVDRAPWRDGFWQAFEKHRKATVYAKLTPEFEVPASCDAVIHGSIGPLWGQVVAQGQIYGDRLGRWRDGHFIHTSPIVSGPDADGIVKTHNSTYKVEPAP